MSGTVLAAKFSWEINLFSCFQETGGEQFGNNQIKTLGNSLAVQWLGLLLPKPHGAAKKQSKTKQKSSKICKCFDPEILPRYCSTETFMQVLNISVQRCLLMHCL